MTGERKNSGRHALGSGPRLFVYGTLKPGYPPHAQLLRPLLAHAKPARMQGRIYDLPAGYPAMTRGNRWVYGWVLELLTADSLATIDAYEGYDPALPWQSFYVRQRREVASPSGRHCGFADVYLMDLAAVRDRGGVLLPAGIWVASPAVGSGE